MMTRKAIEPLRDLLADVVARLEALEAKVGVTPSSSAATAKSAPTPSSSGTIVECIVACMGPW